MDEPSTDLGEAIPACPACGGRMKLVYDRPKSKVCVCGDCHTGVTVPAEAWDLILARWKRKP